jgi:hypothetical protein
MLLEPVLPLAPMPLVVPLPGVPVDAAGSPVAPEGLLPAPVAADGLLDPTAPVSPDIPPGAVELMLPVPPAGGVLAVLSAAPPVPLTAGALAVPLVEPVPDAPGVMVDVDVFGVVLADLSSPQPASERASATPAAMVNCLVISSPRNKKWL